MHWILTISLSFEDLLVAPPPEGQIPDFNNPGNLNTLTRVIITIAIGFVLVFDALRIYVRLNPPTRLTLDDCKYIIALMKNH